MPLLLICFIAALLVISPAHADGDLAIRAKELTLELGSKDSDYYMSTKEFTLETGQAYELEISSFGFKEYVFSAPDFFRDIWVRKIEVEDVEISTPVITEIELESEGEVELIFVPIRTGRYEFRMLGLESRGMVGTITVK